ncbi:TPA: hypothetical protein ACPQXA_000290 [Streptococcus mutans]|jgi:hypothetical protein|uniref:hypothetical protein n=1 Tax=Streptococcus mutans TaxID=1309 RepID=UPI0002B4F2D8|nr:hypothetical protein [Streptococcus mutans]EMB77455.1 hypothetical protein SMU44_08544 [Streptococcus mutans 11VS1]AVM71659.1 hypothetical protein CO204_06185 [Streptococcus mutans]EMC41811.1 hypothetical protein SMU97_07737 [Streptococcus mutans SM4]EMC59337.1 hypothetical protein SMU108_01664 [Streptococcus mutans M230]MCB4962039.1 hypothetical protein [Streptococcus mutans]
MDKRDAKVAELRIEEEKLEELEAAYKAAKDKIEEEFYLIDSFCRNLRNRLDSKYDAVLSDVSSKGGTQETSREVTAIFSSYMEDNEAIRQQHIYRLEYERDKIEQDYKKKISQQDDKIERIYQDLRKIDNED